MLHDLHRAATHANLPIQETPMSAAVSQVMGSCILNNALKCKPTTRAGLMVNGGGYQGKTETVCEIAAAFEDQWLALHDQINPYTVPGTRDLLATVAYVQTPVTATPKSTLPGDPGLLRCRPQRHDPCRSWSTQCGPPSTTTPRAGSVARVDEHARHAGIGVPWWAPEGLGPVRRRG
jgi:hypothetical protein